MHACPAHTHLPVHAHSHARDFVHRRRRITVPPTGSSSCRALHSCARYATKAKAELSVVPVLRHIWPTAPIGRVPRHATVELAAVAKLPVCPCAHARTGRPRPDMCCGVRVTLVEPHRPSCPPLAWDTFAALLHFPCFPPCWPGPCFAARRAHAHATKPSLGKLISDLDLLFARQHPRRVVRRLCRPSPR
jgi:hypothetical protein